MNKIAVLLTFTLHYISYSLAMNSNTTQVDQQHNQLPYLLTPAQAQKFKTLYANNEKGKFKYFKANGKKFVTDY